MKKITALLCVISLLGGCATMNKNECRNADWNVIGFEDGSRGYALDRIGQHRKACAKVDVVPDLVAYEKGHQKGVRQYCTAERGYREGVNGANYQGVCPADLSAAFTRAYRDGKNLYEIKQSINAAAARLSGYRDDIAHIEADIASHEQAIVDSGSSSISRREHLAAIKMLQQNITDLEVNSVAADQELIMLENDYQSLLQQHQKWGY
jgi:hypothetical protein